MPRRLEARGFRLSCLCATLHVYATLQDNAHVKMGDGRPIRDHVLTALSYIFAMGFRQLLLVPQCGDLMFSGHAVFIWLLPPTSLTSKFANHWPKGKQCLKYMLSRDTTDRLISFHLLRHCPVRLQCQSLSLALLMWAFFGTIHIIATRNHYSVDVRESILCPPHKQRASRPCARRALACDFS